MGFPVSSIFLRFAPVLLELGTHNSKLGTVAQEGERMLNHWAIAHQRHGVVVDAGGDQLSDSLLIESVDAVGGQEGLAEGDELIQAGAEGFDFQVGRPHVRRRCTDRATPRRGPTGHWRASGGGGVRRDSRRVRALPR